MAFVEAWKNRWQITSGGRLYVAFGAIGLLTALITALAIYSFDRLGEIVQDTTSNTLPLVVSAERLSERSTLLSASAPSIALAKNTAELEATTVKLYALLDEINATMSDLEGRSSPLNMADIRGDVEALEAILENLKILAEHRFQMRERQVAFLDRMDEVRADFSDTVYPVTYGVQSLMSLFANRAGRRATKSIGHLGNDTDPVLETTIGLLSMVSALQSPALRDTLSADQRRALIASVDHIPYTVDGGEENRQQKLVSGIAAHLRNAPILSQRDLDHAEQNLRDVLNEVIEKEIETHREIARETRDTIVGLINTAVSEGGNSAEIRALGSHVISLLNTVWVLNSTDAVLDMRSNFDRSFDELRDAIGRFEQSALAQNNPILAGNLNNIEASLNDLRNGPLDPFTRRAEMLELHAEIEDRLTEGRNASSRMAERINSW
jgi:phosphoglycerate-specific signal transduction histidine kinase